MKGVSRMSNCLCGCVSQFHDFSQDIRALPGARTCTGPAGDIRGGLNQLLSHSDVGPKLRINARTSKIRYNRIFVNAMQCIIPENTTR